jgi:hypothetical protein
VTMSDAEADSTAQEILDAGFTPQAMAQCMLDMSAENRRLREAIEAMRLGESDELNIPRRQQVAPPSSEAAAKARLRYAVRYFYDLQRLRIQAGGRYAPKAPHAAIEMSEEDQAFFATTSANLNALERQALKEVSGLLDYFPISEWLLMQRGIGPTMAGVIVSSFDIHRANTASALWAVSGLNVVDGKAPRPKKGEKLKYNAWLRTKMVGVMATNFLKTGSPWREHYDNYKQRKQTQIVAVCMACGGAGKKGSEVCKNCVGGKAPAPWGQSDGHRHNAALRYMVKMFLAQLYVEWRTVEGLPVRPPYHEEYHGHVHAKVRQRSLL